MSSVSGKVGAAAIAAIAARREGVAVGSPRPRLNFIDGYGVTMIVSDDGSAINVTVTAVADGAPADWGLVTDAVGSSEDWGSVAGAVDSAITWGAL